MAAFELSQLRPNRPSYTGRIERELAVRHSLGEQGVIHPDVRHELGHLTVGPYPLTADHDLGQPLGGEPPASRLRGYVGMGGKEIAKAGTGCETGTQQKRSE
jgi:hypothetical protein